MVAFRTGAAVLYDVEAARALLTLESRPAGGGERAGGGLGTKPCPQGGGGA